MKTFLRSLPFFLFILGLIILCASLTRAAEKSELEGSWTNQHQGWTFVLEGDKISIKSPNPQLWVEGTFTSDPEADPKEIDVSIEKSGMPQYVGLTSLGLYKIENDVLTFALGEPGKQQRPDEFSSDSGAMIIVLSKDK